MFVPYAVGTNADKRFARACPREELPSFAIGLLKYTATTATGVETMKKWRVLAWVLLLYDFLDKIAWNLIIRIEIRAKNEPEKATETARIFLFLKQIGRQIYVIKKTIKYFSARYIAEHLRSVIKKISDLFHVKNQEVYMQNYHRYRPPWAIKNHEQKNKFTRRKSL